MSLIQCPECKKSISEAASSCPKCGYVLTPEKIAEIKKNQKDLQKKAGIGCLSLIGIIVLISIFSSSENTNTPKTKEQLHKEQIEKLLSPWDGSCKSLTALIKESMDDPGSYEHVDTKYWDMRDHIVVMTTFRGKNAFGGVVKNWVKAKVDLNGKVIKIIEQGP